MSAARAESRSPTASWAAAISPTASRTTCRARPRRCGSARTTSSSARRSWMARSRSPRTAGGTSRTAVVNPATAADSRSSTPETDERTPARPPATRSLSPSSDPFTRAPSASVAWAETLATMRSRIRSTRAARSSRGPCWVGGSTRPDRSSADRSNRCSPGVLLMWPVFSV